MSLVALAMFAQISGRTADAAAAPVPPPAAPYVVGVGRASCATAWEPSYEFATFAWILGYFSGRNVADRAAVGAVADVDGIFAEVRRTCAAQPSIDVAEATERTLRALAVQRR